MAGKQHWRVLVVDDYPAFRETVGRVLEADPRFTIVAEAASGEEAVALAGQMPLDLVLVDLHLPGMNGLATAAAIKASQAEVVVLLLSGDWSPAYERRARAVGVWARLAKQRFSLSEMCRVLDRPPGVFSS